MANSIINIDDFSSRMRSLAKAAGLDRVAAYHLTGSNRLALTHAWNCSKAAEINDELKFPARLPLVADWLAALSNGKCVNISRANMTLDEAVFLCMFGIKALYLTPVIKEGRLFGVLAFEDHGSYRRFDEGCAAVFSDAAESWSA
ncbi:MAG: GAF domain-containing protein, partial [Clostridiales bacterium]|nr:GAF domain-containing protein [Clostridiales bacterium]